MILYIGRVTLPITAVILMGGFVLVAVSFKLYPRDEVKEHTESKNTNLIAFFKKYPAFDIMVIVCLLELIFISCFSFAVIASAAIYYTEDQVESQDRVTGQGIMSLMFSDGTVFGSLIAGNIIDRLGIEVMLKIGIGIAILGGIMAFIAWRIGEKRDKSF